MDRTELRAALADRDHDRLGAESAHPRVGDGLGDLLGRERAGQLAGHVLQGSQQRRGDERDRREQLGRNVHRS